MIDPGGGAGELIQYTKDYDVTAILLTHAHFDHIGALEEVRKEWNCPVYMHAEEASWLEDPQKNGSGVFPGIEAVRCSPPEHVIVEEGPLHVGSFRFDVMYTPGHSPGSISFYLEEENIVFSGDVLFRGGVGRTDLYGGSEEVLLESIHSRLLPLPEDTIVANGHGPETTVGSEKETNPFINGFGW